jgi:8-amino-7-oxononanoate synthase
VYANVALYPAVPRGAALLRTSVMATHERGHLDRALDAFEQAREGLPDDAGGMASTASPRAAAPASTQRA